MAEQISRPNHDLKKSCREIGEKIDGSVKSTGYSNELMNTLKIIQASITNLENTFSQKLDKIEDTVIDIQTKLNDMEFNSTARLLNSTCTKPDDKIHWPKVFF